MTWPCCRSTNQSNLPTVTYGDSDNVQVGDAVVAIGNALGLSAGTPTVTQGIISAKGRTVQASDSTGTSTETLTNMIQTDAAINPGNSGGPLVDSSGMVIGMNTAVASNTDGTSQAQNIGFAIPANKITQLLPELRNKSIGSTSPSGAGYLGVEIETLTSQVRSAYNFVPTQGAVVLQVEQRLAGRQSPGSQQGDVIVVPGREGDHQRRSAGDGHPGRQAGSAGHHRPLPGPDPEEGRSPRWDRPPPSNRRPEGERARPGRARPRARLTAAASTLGGPPEPEPTEKGRHQDVTTTAGEGAADRTADRGAGRAPGRTGA